MFASVGLMLAQFVPAYLGLDVTFRYIDPAPGALRHELRRYGALYAVGAAAFGLAGAWAQWRTDGLAGLVVGAAGNWAPWWLLWRFGLRKQLTFLFKDDGGADRGATKPDL